MDDVTVDLNGYQKSINSKNRRKQHVVSHLILDKYNYQNDQVFITGLLLL